MAQGCKSAGLLVLTALMAARSEAGLAITKISCSVRHNRVHACVDRLLSTTSTSLQLCEQD